MMLQYKLKRYAVNFVDSKEIAPELKKLIAYELTLLHPQDSPEAAARMIGEAKIDPNPHQIEAALYGYQALQRGGAILADEVGLGKTIEAGLIINQYWSEGRRNILIIAPVALRAQWQRELDTLFYLTSIVISNDEWKKQTSTKKNPILRGEPGIYIVSDHLIISNQKAFISNHWDLVVIDEAHRLRNVYRKKKDESVQAKKLRDTFLSSPKLLLTATPFQNSLEELYGLISVIDPSFFGSFESFQRLYSRPSKRGEFNAPALRERLEPIFRRTLRKDVTQYLRYTERKPLTVRHKYRPQSNEDQLHQDVAALLNSEHLLLNSKAARGFFDLVYLKLLGSSPYALNPALLKLVARFLQGLVKRGANDEITSQWITKVKSLMSCFPNWESHWQELIHHTCKSTEMSASSIKNHLNSIKKEPEIIEDDAAIVELAEEWQESNASLDSVGDLSALANPDTIKEQLQTIISNYFKTHKPELTGRGQVFLETIRKHIAEAPSKGYSQKVVVFTEYVRTLQYVKDLLEASPLKDFNIICYHGGLSSKKGLDGLSERDRAIDLFRNSEKAILIATEAGAEGLNLQFCNLLINYDLPWNPQRIEQRIGRCHRYGQKNDVIVINFVCEENQAEKHIFELLSEKFKLFDGVFGASNGVLGAIHSGVDIERLCADIYLGVRSLEEVDRDLDSFLESSEEAREKGIRDVAKKLLEEFDPEVTKILKLEWSKLKEEITLNLTAQEEKLAQIVLSETSGRLNDSKAILSISDARFPILTNKPHTFQRVYANDEIPLITPRHSEIEPILTQLRSSIVNSPGSYSVRLPAEIAKQFGSPSGIGYWLCAQIWRLEGASTFEHLQLFLIDPKGRVLRTPALRQILEHIDLKHFPKAQQSDSNSPIISAIKEEEDLLFEKREEISQKIYNDRITAKQRAKYEQEEAADQIRAERRLVSSDYDVQILKAPMKDKNKILKEKENRLKELDKELEIYQSTVRDLESQESNLHRELTKKHDQGKISSKEIFKVHLVFS
jgi:SNF2 family DNA or RNA helicase